MPTEHLSNLPLEAGFDTSECKMRALLPIVRSAQPHACTCGDGISFSRPCGDADHLHMQSTRPHTCTCEDVHQTQQTRERTSFEKYHEGPDPCDVALTLHFREDMHVKLGRFAAKFMCVHVCRHVSMCTHTHIDDALGGTWKTDGLNTCKGKMDGCLFMQVLMSM
eukprot:c19708_g2_i1 orf=206-700(+)